MSNKLLLKPKYNCNRCGRLRSLILQNRRKEPTWHNGPVNSFGDINSELLIVGLAPGLKGANRTGRAFTGDHSGDLLFSTLNTYGLSLGEYKKETTNDINLNNCRITNAVRCLPPQNKPTGSEIRKCAKFLKSELNSMVNLKVVLALGVVAHGAILAAIEKPKSSYKFNHNTLHYLDKFILANSYHCSRYNINTGRLTEDMFHDVFKTIKLYL